ncbi:hypothetical protein BT93_H0160 [Corymbia citriodora subsp. variegata]|nr:hypothetical protein BT93_H0160 [Corymbia citriodora subsp. variegata]KAF8014236.1 hypothetical protein BT93_H0160 [Corymbia citriodora subsp. variegata]
MASSDVGTSSESDYQVFLSFRGPDTRTGFTDILYRDLTNAGINVFRDDEEIRVGERIDGSLLTGINNSTIYIPIFSRTYASSLWCLRELAHIVANISELKGNKKILPIFFDVDPDDVKLKTSLYHNAILNLENEKKLSSEQVGAWRDALMTVGKIRGWEVKKYKGHGELINLVVEDVIKELKTKHRPVTEYLVGIDHQVTKVTDFLDVNSGGVRLIQIYGMGGIGKTTLAKVVYNKLCSDFGKCCCFLGDVRSKSSRKVGLIELQKKLLFEIGHPVGTKSIDEIHYATERIEKVLRTNKVLLVLDDVDNNEQVEILLGKSTLCSGSRILITTRNKDTLQIRRPEEDQNRMYEMELMSSEHALQLFSKHAFDRDSPSIEYSDLSKEIVHATGRLPLALEVIGSLLYHKKKQEQWKQTLEDLRKAPDEGVLEKLMISYDALTFEQQQIFLDIACFFIDEKKTDAMYMWEDCGLPKKGVDVLDSRCLIKIERNKFWMHDQLRDLGREIVRKENPMNPEKRSRLWIHEEILDAITTEEMKNAQTLDIGLWNYDWKDIESEEIGRFKDLRCLKLGGGTFIGNLTNCLTKLRWIFWSHPPPTSKSTDMHFKNVVVLRIHSHDFMDDSMLQSLIEMAIKLKVLSIENCPRITRTPQFPDCRNLKRLTFIKCSNLREIDSSIRMLKDLIKLKIASCWRLKNLPEEIGDLKNLEQFFCQGISVENFPDFIWKLKSLRKLSFDSLAQSNSSCKSPSDIGMLGKMEVLILRTPLLEGQLSFEIEKMSSLRILDLSETRVSEVPKTISKLSCLQRLELNPCNEIQELPALPTSLTHLLVSSTSLQVTPDLSNLTNLVELKLSEKVGGLHTSELRGLGRLTKLTKLSLELHNFPVSIEVDSLPLLKELDLLKLDRQTFPQLPLSLQNQRLDNFNSVMSIFPNLRDLLLEFIESPVQEFQLDGLQFPHLKNFTVNCCKLLERFKLSNVMKLTRFVVKECPVLMEIGYACPFELLEDLCIKQCKSLERLFYQEEAGHDDNDSVKDMIICEGRLILPSEALKNLRNFELNACDKIREIHVVGTSESWEVFEVSFCPSLRSIHGLADLQNLGCLSIKFCKELQDVEGVDDLGVLVMLVVEDCESLERLIDISTTKLPDCCDMRIRYGWKLCGFKEDFEGCFQAYMHKKLQ